MSNQPFIVFRTYKDLSSTECLLMSWIISLSEAKQVICFSNQYASKRLKVSSKTITRSIKNLKSLGYINTFMSGRETRFIHLLKYPQLEDLSVEVCELNGVEDNSTPDNLTIDNLTIDNLTIDNKSIHPTQNVYTPETNCPDTIDKMSRNNKEQKKAENKAVEAAAAPQFKLHQFKKETDEDYELFGYMFNEFNEPESRFDELFDMWFKLPPLAQEDSFLYSTKYVKYCKERKMKINLYYYLLDEKYNWESIRKMK